MFGFASRMSLALGSVIMMGHAKKFLDFQPLSQQDVDKSLAAEIAGNISSEHLESIEKALQTVYTALPKSENGRLGHQAVRYVLHRFFVQQHGWYVRGLEPNGDTFSSLSAAAPLKDWIASYVQGRFEERSGSAGIDLRELAALAATLEDLIRKEAALELQEVYNILGFPTTGQNVSLKQAEEALETYMMIYLTNRNVSISTRREAEMRFKRFSKRYSGWAEARAFLAGIEHRHDDDLKSSDGVEFAVTARVVAEVGEQFASFNDVECKDLKATLMGMSTLSGKIGRIRLHEFYNKSLYTHWKFTEKAAYLKELGALDESDPNQPRVILPNYLSSFSNCLKATSLYAVCCRNECEELLGHLEREIAAPTAKPARIGKLIADLPSATVAAPRQLPEALLERLNRMAEANGGEVHLHSRLFAQWMHHAFPLECPYPHEAGQTNPQTAAEWMAKTGSSAHVSEDEMRKVVEDACSADGPEAAAALEPELPWSDAEELLVPAHSTTRRGTLRVSVLLLGLGALAWLAIGRLAHSPDHLRKLRMVLGFSCLILVLCAADLIDMTLFLPLAVGVVILGTLRGPCAEPVAKCEKCCV